MTDPFNASMATDSIAFPPINGETESIADFLFSPAASHSPLPLFRNVIKALTMIAPKLSLQFNKSGLWARTSMNAFAVSMFFSPIDYCTCYRYNTDEPYITLNLFTHELAQALENVDADTLLMFRVPAGDASILYLETLNEHAHEYLEVALSAPHDLRSSGAWVPPEIAQLPRLGNPISHSSHYYAPSDILRALKQHRASPNIQFTLDRHGCIIFTSEHAGNKRDTKLSNTFTDTIMKSGQILNNQNIANTFSNSLLTRLLKCIEKVPKCQFTVQWDGSDNVLQFLTRNGFYSHLHIFVCNVDACLPEYEPPVKEDDVF